MLDIAPALETNAPDLYCYLAAGLVGDGSDCFGYDDAISADHDTQTRIKIWIPEGVGGQGAAERIRSAVSLNCADSSARAAVQNIEVHEVHTFYRRYTGLDFTPHTWREWFAIPQHNLATATNGEVFYDGGGRFTQRRKALLAYYPADVRLKLLESALLQMGQAGQYNYPRLKSRGEIVAADMARAIFVRNLLSAVFILNQRYIPFYKWAHRAVRELPILGEFTAEILERIVTAEEASDDIEVAAQEIIGELRTQALTNSETDFLVPHATEVRNLIIEPELKEENPWKI